MNQRYGTRITGVSKRGDCYHQRGLSYHSRGIFENGKLLWMLVTKGGSVYNGRGLVTMCMWLCVLVGITSVGASEFPERECCDPVYPPVTVTTSSPPVTHPVGKISGKLNLLLSYDYYFRINLFHITDLFIFRLNLNNKKFISIFR
ncbi:unnamed protein product [Pieris macdunnoughi]|uniref:Uncharacterized protein n=1 Tax=Pieris macdunnoughi TaxID=345717 RepID=A0A821WJY3_9NEOP|nr:unnamed protein product [Pieris macdunnoughi]